MMQKTFAMIKPHAVSAKNAGDIIKMIELNGFTIVDMRKELMSRFYVDIPVDEEGFGDEG